MYKYQTLLSRVSLSIKHNNELARITGSDFNVFKIIKFKSDELKHSAFLAELLNPKGSHGQGSIFLKLFIEKNKILNFSCETAVVTIEKWIGNKNDIEGGRIDIFIEDQKGNFITIENKVDAKDQEKQLIRYHNHHPKNIFYLTKFGVEANSISTEDEVKSIKLQAKNDYKCISYKYDIIDWLEQCQKEAVLIPLVREGITHYINLIKSIVGQSTNKAMNEEIVKLISESPINLSSAREISNNYFTALSNIQLQFWEALNNKLQNDNSDFIVKITDNTYSKEKTENYYKKGEVFFGIWSEIFNKNGVTIHWGCEITDSINIGFTLEKDGKGGISNLDENQRFRDVISSCDSKYIQNKYWLGRQTTETELNFRNFDDTTISNLINDMDKIVFDIANKAIHDIKYVQSKLSAF